MVLIIISTNIGIILNKDNTPEIIIEKKDGAKVVYDIKNNDISFDIDGDKIEKIR